MSPFEKKLTKIGNGIGVTLPAELLREAGFVLGENVEIEVENGKIILEKKVQVNLSDVVDAVFKDVLNDVIREHDRTI